MSGVRRSGVRASTISLNNISSETAYWILTKLHRNDPWVVLYQSCSNRFTLNYVRKTSNDIFSWTTNGNLTKLNRNDPWVVPYHRCSNRSSWLHKSRGQYIGFKYKTFKNLFVWNYKAQSFHVWYIASSRGSLPKLFKLCPWGQNWPHPGGHNFTLIYLRQTSNDIFSLTTYGNLTKHHRNDPWVVPYQSCSNHSSWLHK